MSIESSIRNNDLNAFKRLFAMYIASCRRNNINVNDTQIVSSVMVYLELAFKHDSIDIFDFLMKTYFTIDNQSFAFIEYITEGFYDLAFQFYISLVLYHDDMKHGQGYNDEYKIENIIEDELIGFERDKNINAIKKLCTNFKQFLEYTKQYLKPIEYKNLSLFINSTCIIYRLSDSEYN